MGVYKYRDVINIKAADEIIYISPGAKTLSRSDSCLQGRGNSAFVKHRSDMNSASSDTWEASRPAMAQPRWLRPMNPGFVNNDGDAGIINGCGAKWSIVP